MTLQTTAALLALSGLLLLGLALFRLRRGRLLRAGGMAASGLLLAALGLTLAGIATNLYTYQRFTAEQPVARLSFQRLSPQRYQVHLVLADGTSRELELLGDEWQLDARILKWTGPATWLGWDTAYRLERLSGRYQDLQQELHAPRSAHALNHPRGLDLWRLAHQLGGDDGLPWLDTLYGSAAYLPMTNGADYTVTLGTQGLIARPSNPAGRRGTRHWSRQP